MTTKHAQKLYDRLGEMNAAGRYPSVRSLEDALETNKPWAERWGGEVQGLVDRGEDDGRVYKFHPGDADYPPAPEGHEGEYDTSVVRLKLLPDEVATDDADGEA
jgi:hypothetical protein